MGNGYLEILNVGAGDMKITFDKEDPAELIRAKRIIQDMLRRGFALLVKQGDAWTRVERFDAATGEYLIADYAPEEAVQTPVHIDRGSIDAIRLKQDALPAEIRRAEDEGAVFEPAAIGPSIDEQLAAAEPVPEPLGGRKGKGIGQRTRRVKVEDAKVTAVGRSAGG